MRKTLYLPSTPLNLLVSLVHAVTFREQQESRLILIDQRRVKDNPYHQLLNQWQDSPFSSVQILSGQARGSKKIAERRQSFAWLSHYLTRWQPEVVAVGSDRRIEFQYVMAYLQGKQAKVQGHYLDDGLYSYMPPRVSAWKSVINAFLHRQVYGQWWQEPSTIGASNWIEDAWLFAPDLAVEALRNKQVHQLLPDWFQHEQVVAFSRLAWKHFSGKSSFPDVDQVLLLPHPHNTRHIPDYAKLVQRHVNAWVAEGRRVAIKYHPRVGDEDPFQLTQMNRVVCLPTGLATELLLPMLKPQVELGGEASTALLTAHWLRPDIGLVAYLHPKNRATSIAYLTMLARLGIRTQSFV